MSQKKIARFAETNCIVIDTITDTTARAYIDITERSLNLYGIIHGGLIFSLADSTASACAKADDKLYVTLQANINYLEAIDHGRITATGTVIRRGTMTCVVDVDVHSDEGVHIAKGTFTMYQVTPNK